MKKFIYISFSFCLFTFVFLFYNKVLIPKFINEAPKSPGAIPRYKKNDWTSQKCISQNGNYIYTYKFRDFGNQTRIWKWSAPKKDSDHLINRFGVPPSIYQPFIPTTDVIAKRKKQLEDGYFKRVNNLVGPDHSAIVSDSRPLLTGLTNLVKEAIQTDGLSAREAIELIMAFCQDIPYGVPPDNYEGKVISGMFPPPLILNKTWGDCDTKSTLFASIYLSIPGGSMVLLESPGHISVGVEGIPGPYDQAVSFEGKKYIFAEPVGPGKKPFGGAISPYVQINNVHRINIEKELAQSNQPVLSEAVSLGNTIMFTLKEDNASIADRLKLFYNHVGENYSYYEITSPPKKDGSIKYSSEKNKIFLMINQTGYYHYGSYDIRKKTNLDLDFSEGNCIYIKTRPGKNVYLFKHQNGRYTGMQFKADRLGVIRAILESGEYLASLSQTITGTGLKRFNRDEKIGITFSL